MIDIPCKCGHEYSKHCAERFPHFYNKLIDNECYGESDREPDLLCACLNYIPDNLAYIEQVAKERGLLNA
jgi:hypothetical protein